MQKKFAINVTNHCKKYFKKIKIYRKKVLQFYQLKFRTLKFFSFFIYYDECKKIF